MVVRCYTRTMIRMTQPRVVIAEGAVHLPSWMPVEAQQKALHEIRALADGEAGFYTPILRNGARMRVRMLCCGRHWDAKTYRYDLLRTDVDGLPAPPIPEVLRQLACEAAESAGFSLEPDVLLVNWYGAEGRMGLHQDKDERPEIIASGVPIVSLSIGDAAIFEFGGARRKDPVQRIRLESGDAFVFGGSSRLNHHGIASIVAGTGPTEFGVAGRYNLTFRQY